MSLVSRRLARLAALAATLGPALCPAPSQASELTDLELRWLRGATPVLQWARQAGLPVDVVVQPQDSPDAAPLALAYVDGRCKLVLSMRGNPEAAAVLGRLPADLRDAGLELMAAHELGHCHRRVDGAWAQVPAGVRLEAPPEVLDAQDKSAWNDMKATRREEGFADLAGLAWVASHRPAQYAALHAWLLGERAPEHRLPGSHHDTMAWLALVPEAAALAGQDPFAAAAPKWVEGLSRPE